MNTQEKAEAFRKHLEGVAAHYAELRKLGLHSYGIEILDSFDSLNSPEKIDEALEAVINTEIPKISQDYADWIDRKAFAADAAAKLTPQEYEALTGRTKP